MALPKKELTKIYGLLAEFPEDETKPEFMNNKFNELLVNDMYLDEEVARVEGVAGTKVPTATYNVKMNELDQKNLSQDEDINTRVLKTVYDAKMTEIDNRNFQQDNSIANKVNNATFTAAKQDLEDAIMQKLSNTEYAEEKALLDKKIEQLQTTDVALQTDINKRVLTETYSIDKAALEKSIADNVKTLNEKNTSQDTEINKRVLSETYATDKTALEESIAGKTTTSLNGEQTNVNFIVENGVISKLSNGETEIPLKGEKGDTGAKGEPGTASVAIDDTVTNFEQTWTSQKISDTIMNNFSSTAESETSKFGSELLSSIGWTSNGWTGDFNTGFIHTVGQTSPLIYPVSVEGGKVYKVELTLTNVSQGVNGASYNDFTMSIGGTPTFEVYEGTFDVHTFVYGITVLNDSSLIITPRADWDGTISNISVKEVIGTIPPVLTIVDSTGANSFETRPTKAEKDNVFIGKSCGENTFGGRGGNVGIGANAMKYNTTGFWNTAIGDRSLHKNAIGTRNVAIGLVSLFENISGDRNVAVGTFALHRNTTGRNNIAFGADALWYNTSGNNNIAISNCALDHNTTGSANIALGQYAMYSNTTGGGNVAIGHQALNSNTTAGDSTAVGIQSLYNNTTGLRNNAFGAFTLLSNSTGTDNSAFGYKALNKNVSDYNTAFGASSLELNTTGGRNTALGFRALRSITTGSYNIAIGANVADDVLSTGSNNILIGYDIDTPNSNTSNYLSIGNLLFGDLSSSKVGIKVQTPTAFLHVRQGNTETPPIKVNIGTSITTTPQAGALEFYGNDIFYTGQDGTRRKLVFTE